MYGNEVPTISSVSQLSIASCEGCSQQANAAGGVRTVVRHSGFAEQRLDNGRREPLGQLFELC